MHVRSTLQSRDSLCLLTAGSYRWQAGTLAHTHTSTLQKIPNEALKTQITGGASTGSRGGNANEGACGLTVML